MLAFALLLAAAAPTETVLAEDQVRQMKMVSSSGSAEANGNLKMLKGAALESALRAAIVDKTRAVLIEGHGIYLIHATPDGRIYGWFPGQPAVVGGTWGVQKFSSKMIVACQRFDRPNNPRTGPYLASECKAADVTLGGTDVLQQWDGDPFGLDGGRVPFVKQPWGLPAL